MPAGITGKFVYLELVKVILCIGLKFYPRRC